MPNVTVNPIQRINVRVNQTANRPTVSSTSTFVGASDQQAQIDYAVTTANTALQAASQALVTANTALDVATTANTAVNQLGTTVDGGEFS